MRRANECRVKHSWKLNIVDVLTATDDKFSIFNSLDALTDFSSLHPDHS
jgi:hypothetical protein